MSVKRLPWAGWNKEVPSSKQRIKMYKKCGKKCFLGTSSNNKQSPNFPICKKKTCKISKKGLYAAYIRARQWGSRKSILKGNNKKQRRKTYKNIANKSKEILRKHGYKIG
jgi:hypothetical protein